jgi:hypothetical protein
VDNERVVARHSAPIIYRATSAASGNSYSEVLYERDPDATDNEYNVDVVARAFLPTNSNQPKGYIVKLVNQAADLALQGSGAELQIRRMNGTSLGPPLNPVKVASLVGTNCSATIPLATSGSTDPVWVRIEVKGGPAEDPSVMGEVAWGGCTETGAMSSCSSYCHFSAFWEDNNDPAGMKGQTGSWGYFVHHKDKRVEAFRAGSANP